MFNSQAVAQRQNGQVALYLSKEHLSPPIPFELHGHISPEDWTIRIPALTNLASKYYKPVFERVWLCFAVVVALVLPLALYRSIFIAIHRTEKTSTSMNTLARFIGFLVFSTGLLLFWAPVFIWKLIGHRRVCALLTSYSESDAARRHISGFVPKWKISTPGIFSTHTVLTLTTPPTAPITSFHPDAYLPTYISKIEEAQGAYFYPYPAAASHEAGLPRMSVIGGYGAQESLKDWGDVPNHVEFS